MSGTSTPGAFKLLRDATDVGVGTVAAAFMPVSSALFFDAPAAGTYTYKIQIKTGGAGLALIVNAKLVAYEIH